MENKRLVITIFIVIVLVSVLVISNTYSIFTSENADPNTNVYKTGNLDITYEIDNDNVKFTDSKPVSENEVGGIKPYRIKVTNYGNVDYKFNIILEDTTATDVIDYKYIMVKVGKFDSFSLASATNNIIREGVVVKANSSVVVDVKIYISDAISNTEVGKNFSAKLSINGIAIYSSNTDIDNSNLVSDYQLLSSASAGSFVLLLDNGDDEIQYCYNTSNKYRFDGYRLLYTKDGVPYLISSGASYCYDNDGAINMIEYINSKLYDYCDIKYMYDGKCNSDTIHAFNISDYKEVIGSNVSDCENKNDLYCGYGNDIINNDGYYWIIDSNSNLKQFYWDPVNGYVNSTSKHNLEYGVRVVLKLDKDVYIEKGIGTFDSPYVIKNTDKLS